MRNDMDFETKLAVIEAGQACENAHAWHAILHATGHTSEEIETFWAKYRDDIYWGYNMCGLYGREEVTTGWAGGLEGSAMRLYPVFNEMYPETKNMDPLPLSEYSLHAIGTPIVEVGADLKTARALYYSTGMLYRRISTSGTQAAVWMLERYGEDYVREDGFWKILHECVLSDTRGEQDTGNFGVESYKKMNMDGKPGGPGGPGGPGRAPGGPTNTPQKGQKYSKMAGGGPPKGSLPPAHKDWNPIQPAQDSTPWPEPFNTLDNVSVHYVVGLGENKGAVPKKKL